MIAGNEAIGMAKVMLNGPCLMVCHMLELERRGDIT